MSSKKNGADVGAFIRKKGLYSSTISLWRKQRNEGLLGVEGKKRGPKSKVTPEMIEIQRLQKEKEKLSKSLSQAQKIIEIQKKLGRCTWKRKTECRGNAQFRQRGRNSFSGVAEFLRLLTCDCIPCSETEGST
ncbi:MAG: hypothetical protein ING65_03295 [Rhodocyclaceae bacterium]|nr:hypothetical protein [Rhodocyclaceae bacterium]